MSSEEHPYAEHYRALHEMFVGLLAEVSAKLQSSDLGLINEFLEHNEFGVAFDH